MATSSADGFSLIEVLIALFVLSVGVIGAASMQLTALRMAQQSSLQTTALHLAVDMAEMMRGHASQMPLDDVASPYLAIADQTVGDASDAATPIPTPTPTPTLPCYGKDAACSPAEFARAEISRWLQRVRRDLPDARVRVCRDAQPWDLASGQYRWTCTDASNAAIVIKLGWPDKTQAAYEAPSAGTAHKNFAPVIALPVVLPTI